MARRRGSPGGARVVAQFALAAVLVGASGHPTSAQQPSQAETRKKLIDEAKEREKALTADVEALQRERERLNSRLIEESQRIQQSEANLTAHEQRLEELDAQEKLLRGSLAQQHARIASLLSVLQRMGRNPPPVMITERRDALKMVRSAMLLSATFPEMKRETDVLNAQLSELQRVTTDQRSERDRLKNELANHETSRVKLASLMEEKRQSLTSRREELERARRLARELVRDAGDLRELMEKLQQAMPPPPEQQAYDRQLEAQRPASPPSEPEPKVALRPTLPEGPTPPQAPGAPPATTPPQVTPPAPPAAPPVAQGTPDQPKVAAVPAPRIVLAPRPGQSPANLARPGRMAPAIPFAEAKGLLPRPAQGSQIISFGERTPYGSASKGIVIQTRPNARVVSPSDGWVVYVGEFRSYGQILIINAGGGYHVVLAGLNQIDVSMAQFVLAGEPVGLMGAASRSAQTPESAPVLFVEFRTKEGRSIDPTPWWIESAPNARLGSQKVQG